MKTLRITGAGFLVLCCSLAFACRLTLLNDTKQEALVVALDGVEADIITPNSQIVFGTPEKHANFVVMHRDVNNKFRPKYKVNQVACSDNHDLHMKLSEIEQGSESCECKLFKITSVDYTKIGTTPSDSSTSATSSAQPSEHDMHAMHNGEHTHTIATTPTSDASHAVTIEPIVNTSLSLEEQKTSQPTTTPEPVITQETTITEETQTTSPSEPSSEVTTSPASQSEEVPEPEAPLQQETQDIIPEATPEPEQLPSATDTALTSPDMPIIPPSEPIINE